MDDLNPFSDRLLTGESIVWAGRPAAGLLLTSKDAFLIPLTLLWFGVMAFSVLGSARNATGFSILFGLILMCIALFFFAGRFLLDAWYRRGTHYGLTNRRVLILRTRPNLVLVTMDLGRIADVQISERADGRGSIHFGQQQTLYGFGRGGFSMWLPTLDPTPQFIAILNARKVFDLVQRGASSGQSLGADVQIDRDDRRSSYESELTPEPIGGWVAAGLSLCFLIVVATVAAFVVQHPIRRTIPGSMHRWAAISISDNGQYGDTWGYRGVAAAIGNAQKWCAQQKGAVNCRSRGSVYDGCIAYAVSSPEKVFITEIGVNDTDARNAALTQCWRTGGSQCFIYTHFCSFDPG